MPIYTYTCETCDYVFEELVPFDKRDDVQICSLCNGKASRGAAETFGIHTTIDPRTDTVYSPKEIDKVVGEKAEKKWAGYNQRWANQYKARQEKRWAGATPAPVNIPKDSDGRYTPVMHLGDKKDRETRREFSTALQEHRAERKKKGIGQFDGPGSIIQD